MSNRSDRVRDILPPTRQPKKMPVNRGRRIKIGLGVVAALAVFASYAVGTTMLRSSDNADTRAQAKAVAAYMSPVQAATNGQLRLDTHNDGTVHQDGRTYFNVTLGNCPNVDAYVTSARRPKLSDKLGALHVVVPGTNPSAASAEPIIDYNSKDWATPFLQSGSGLKQCLPAQ